jgi:HAMP domain-containing protein
MMRVRRSIRSELLRLTVVVAAVFFTLLALSTYQEVQQERKQPEESVLVLAQLTAAHTERLLADAEQTLAHIAERPLVRAMDPAHCDPALPEFAPLFTQFVGIGVVTADGSAICAQSQDPNAPPLSVADREWFLRVKQTQAFTVGQVQVGRVSGRWVAVLVYPVHNEAGDFVGAITLPMDLERYQANFNDLTLPPNAAITIIDSNGTIVARSLEPERWVGQNTRGVEATDRVLVEGEGFAIAPGIDGINRVFGYTPVPHAGWYVYAGIPTEIAFGPVRAILLCGLILSLAFVTLVTVLLIYLQQQVARPVMKLAQVSQAVAQGQLNQRVTIEGPQEMAEVIQQFNQMLDVRAQHTEQLQQVAQTSLALNPILTPEEILPVVVEQTRQILQAHLCLASLVASAEMERPVVVTALSEV